MCYDVNIMFRSVTTQKYITSPYKELISMTERNMLHRKGNVYESIEPFHIDICVCV